MQKLANCQLLIDTKAIDHNIAAFREKIGPEKRLMVMLKAHGYGTDSATLAHHLIKKGVDIFGVAYVSEAIHLRQHGISSPIFVIHAPFYELTSCLEHDLEIAISDLLTIDTLQTKAFERNIQCRVHLHIDTGMSRFGCRAEDALRLATKITASSHLILDGIMTHFACADNPLHDTFSSKQHDALVSAIHTLRTAGIDPTWKHAANSSAMARFSFSEYNMVRVGLALYGIHTSPATATGYALLPALTLGCPIVALQECRQEDNVSYGNLYTVQSERMRLAILPVGYADGIHRCYSQKGYALIHGKKARFIGAICMDYMMVDVTDIPEAAVGDTAVLFAPNSNALTVEEFAALGQTIPHELISGLGPRITRRFV